MAVPPPPAPPGPPESWVATPPAVPFPAAQEITRGARRRHRHSRRRSGSRRRRHQPLGRRFRNLPRGIPRHHHWPSYHSRRHHHRPTSTRAAGPQLSELAHAPVRTSEAPPPPEPPWPLDPPPLPSPPSPATPPPLNPPAAPACAPVDVPPWPPTSTSTAAPGETANTASASPPSRAPPPLPPPCAPNAATVIEFTPNGTVKLCAAPVKEKLQVTVLAASEQPGGNAATAEPASANHPKLTRPTVATDSQTPAPRTRDDNQPTNCAAPKITATHLHTQAFPAHNNARNVTRPPRISNSTARPNTAEMSDKESADPTLPLSRRASSHLRR